MIVFKCEHAGCNSTHPYSPSLSSFAYDQLPATWVSYFPGRARDVEGHIFCSLDCLKKHLGVSEPVQQPVEQSQSKMRRFLLFDENAEEYEGTQWGNGCVTIDPLARIIDFGSASYYKDWQDFKLSFPNCGVIWIDQETKEEEMSHAAD